MEEKKSTKGPCRLSVPMDEEPELQAYVQQKIQELGDSCVVEQGRVMNTVQWVEGMDVDEATTLTDEGRDPRVTRERFTTFRIPAPPSSYKGSWVGARGQPLTIGRVSPVRSEEAMEED